MEFAPVVVVTLVCASVWIVVYIILGILGWKFTPVVSLEEYFVGGRKLGYVVNASMFIAGTLSAWTALGMAGLGYKTGIGLWLWVGPCALAMMIIGRALLYPAWLLGRKYGYVSCADLFMDRYESKTLGLIWSAIWIAMSAPYVVGQIMGVGVLFEGVTGGLLSYEFGAIFMMVACMVYIAIGGVRGFAWAAVVQTASVIGVLGITMIWMAMSYPGGLPAAFQAHIAANSKIISMPGPIPYWTMPMIVSWWFFIAMAWLTWAHLFPRFYTMKDWKVLPVTLLAGSIIGFSPIGLYMIPLVSAILGPLLVPGLKVADLIFPVFVAKYTPLWWQGIFVAGVMAAIMSTAAGYLLSLGGLLTREIYQMWVRPQASQRELVAVGRISIIIWTFICLLIALTRPGLIAFIIAMSMAGQGSLFPAMVCAFYWRRANKYGAIAGPLVGCAFLAWQVAMGKGIMTWGTVHPGIWTILISFAVFIIVSLLTPPPKETTQRKFCDYVETRIHGKV